MAESTNRERSDSPPTSRESPKHQRRRLSPSAHSFQEFTGRPSPQPVPPVTAGKGLSTLCDQVVERSRSPSKSPITTDMGSAPHPSRFASDPNIRPPDRGSQGQLPGTRLTLQALSKPVQRPETASGPRTAARPSASLVREFVGDHPRRAASPKVRPSRPSRPDAWSQGAGRSPSPPYGTAAELTLQGRSPDTRLGAASHEEATRHPKPSGATSSPSSSFRAAGQATMTLGPARPLQVPTRGRGPAVVTSGAARSLNSPSLGRQSAAGSPTPRREAGQITEPSRTAGSSSKNPRGVQSATEPSKAAGPSRDPLHQARLAHGTSSESRSPTIRLGIETEFMLAAVHSEQRRFLIDSFVEELAINYNKMAATTRHPRMHRKIMLAEEPDDYLRWSMVHEYSILTVEEPWGLELRTPVITVEPAWRNNVLFMWEYLEKYYRITSNSDCATHIHISITPQYDLNQVKRIAAAVLYFEPAFEALVPEHRTGNGWVHSNWLESPCLAQKNKSRPQSIALIERAPDMLTLISLMQNPGDPRYAWNFWSLTSTKHTMEFRKPPASVSGDEVLSWTELALNFIQVSIKYGSSRLLQNFPANIAGLRSFLQQVNEPGVNQPERLNRLWAGKPAHAALEPVHAPPILEKSRTEIKTKTTADMKRVRSHPKFTQGYTEPGQ